jgi:hypothetical protein
VEATPRRPHAVVTCGSLRRVLLPGQTLTFGRGRAHDFRLGHAPEDLRVPRFAGKLECRADGVLVHNMSDKRTLEVQTFPGPGYDVLPLMIAGTQPHLQVKVVVKGASSTYAITVDTRQLYTTAASSILESAFDERGTVGFERIESMSRKHRLLLSALCLPLMTQTGPKAAVPTYREIEDILRRHGRTYRAKTVRNGLDELRGWLTDQHGIADLVAPEGERPRPNDNFVEALAHWAIRSGNVTDLDLEQLEADDRDPPAGERS